MVHYMYPAALLLLSIDLSRSKCTLSFFKTSSLNNFHHSSNGSTKKSKSLDKLTGYCDDTLGSSTVA